MSNLKHNGRLRWVPSYLRRQGQATRGQRRAIREHWPRFGLTFRHGFVIDLAAAFDTDRPVVMEIGFGMGDHLVARAAEEPDTPFLGIEVHRPGLGSALTKIVVAGLSNVRLIRGDARLVLSDHLDGRPFREIVLLFPEPWPRPDDAHRRIMQPDLLALSARRLSPGGTFRFATDVVAYATEADQVFATHPEWTAIDPAPRPRTCYEAKGIAEGREISDRAWRFEA